MLEDVNLRWWRLRSRRVLQWAVKVASVLVGLTGWIANAIQADDTVASPIAADAYAILNRSCFECHGPARQEGGLRLDSNQAIELGGDSGSPFDVLNPDESELMRRIRLPKGHDEVMPKRGAVLTDREVSSIREWIASGGQLLSQTASNKHWAYIAPTKPPVALSADQPTQHPIDYFIQKRLDSEGLAIAPAPELPTLARRLYLDTIGLPPTPAEVDAFAADAAADLPAAVDRWVDRLLQFPQTNPRHNRSH